MTIARVSPAEAHARMTEGWTYLDVRSAEEFAAGRPAGAVNVPVMHLGGGGFVENTRFVEEVAARFAKDAPLVVGCKQGQRSLRAAELLAGAGFTRVLEQRAGWDGARDAFGSLVEPGWSRAGLPTERDA